MIRPVMPTDIPMVVSLAKEMHAEGRYRRIPFSEEKLKRVFLNVMKTGVLVGFVDEKNEKIVGAVMGYVTDYMFADEFLLVDYGLYVLPDYRKSHSGAKLLKKFIEVGKNLGVWEICMGSSNTEDPELLAPLYSKMGFTKVGNIYKMEVQ